MARGGHNKKPTLQVIREGNPGHRPIAEGIVLPPSDLVAPNWADLLPGRSAEMVSTRKVAADLWDRTAVVLQRSAGLRNEQREVLVEFCVTYARIVQGERALSKDGPVIKTYRGGQVRNPWTTVLNQYRSHFRALMGELGLTPRSASTITSPDLPDEDDPFDD